MQDIECDRNERASGEDIIQKAFDTYFSVKCLFLFEKNVGKSKHIKSTSYNICSYYINFEGNYAT